MCRKLLPPGFAPRHHSVETPLKIVVWLPRISFPRVGCKIVSERTTHSRKRHRGRRRIPCLTKVCNEMEVPDCLSIAWRWVRENVIENTRGCPSCVRPDRSPAAPVIFACQASRVCQVPRGDHNGWGKSTFAYTCTGVIDRAKVLTADLSHGPT